MAKPDIIFRGAAARLKSTAVRAKRAAQIAATGVTLGLAALPADAQSVKVTVPPPGQTQVLREIPNDHCKYLLDVTLNTLEQHGRDFISATTRKSLNAFFAYNDQELPTCKGPRRIAWERGSDFDFVTALGVSATLAYKPVDFRRDYGLLPTDQPVVPAFTTGTGSQLKAPQLHAPRRTPG